jgi:hypothetical protein
VLFAESDELVELGSDEGGTGNGITEHRDTGTRYELLQFFELVLVGESIFALLFGRASSIEEVLRGLHSCELVNAWAIKDSMSSRVVNLSSGYMSTFQKTY